MVPQNTVPELDEVIRAKVPVATGTNTLGALYAMDFLITASHKDNYIHSWLQDTVEAHQLLLDKIVCFAMSDFGGGVNAVFCLMITCAVRRYGFLLRTPLLKSADRTLLMHTWPFVMQPSKSWASLKTQKRSIN
jgi:L-fucose mutarotase/ribose pyranase (RbsD/FucU family)